MLTESHKKDIESLFKLFKNKEFIVFVEERGHIEAKAYRLEKRTGDLYFASPQDLIDRVERVVETFKGQGRGAHVVVDESGISIFAEDGEVVGWNVGVRLGEGYRQKIREIFSGKRWLSFTSRWGRLENGTYYGEDASVDKYSDAEDLIGNVEEVLGPLVREGKDVYVDVSVGEGEITIVAYAPGTWDGEEFSWSLEKEDADGEIEECLEDPCPENDPPGDNEARLGV